MILQTDYRKLRVVILIGVALGVAAVITYLKLEGTGKAIWTWFFLVSSLLFISIGLLVKSRFKLTDTYLEASNILGLGRNKINLADVRSTKSIDKEFPVTSHLNNPLWLILRDKKFKRIKKLRLFGSKGILLTIDGHFLVDSDFEHLKKKLKKPTYNIM
ncbi:hypothetical protein [Telluribacter sp.]|jgi:hypothetical protein|uniref:hypothetical protein n=1 Tax=Telluribacter sp. TaxID=1978767 RepID=UPI002E0FD1FE|nr:hypothetical protein [Telluribacter sp.]